MNQTDDPAYQNVIINVSDPEWNFQAMEYRSCLAFQTEFGFVKEALQNRSSQHEWPNRIALLMDTLKLSRVATQYTMMAGYKNLMDLFTLDKITYLSTYAKTTNSYSRDFKVCIALVVLCS